MQPTFPGDHVVENLIQNLSAHPMIAIAVIFIGLLVVYLLFKQLLKLALLSLLIFLAVGGYFYFKDPDKMPQNMMETLEKAGTEAVKAVDKGKEVYSKSKAMAEKGKKLAEGMENLRIGKDGKTDKATEAGIGSKGQH
jgi:ABC-type multidrug transport system fused ATPase/permease subunit